MANTAQPSIGFFPELDDFPFLIGMVGGVVPFGPWTLGRPNPVVILDGEASAGAGLPVADGGFPFVAHAETARGSATAADTPTEADWFEQVHILPRTKIDFGNIVTQVQETYELYSAFRTVDDTETSIVNNASPGVTIPDNTPPVVVPPGTSILDSATTPQTTGALGTIVPARLVAAPDGLPLFDTTIDFIFIAGGTLTLAVAGTRLILMPMQYEAPMKETLAFLTDIITAMSGHEQRIALRKNARNLFEVIYKLDANDRQRMQALLMDWTDNIFGFPLWQDAVRLTTAATVGTTVYQTSGADEVDFRDGGLAVVLVDATVFDVINVVSTTATTITAGDPSVNAYPVGTRIMPMRAARILGAVSGRRHRNVLEDFKVIFEVDDSDTGALTGSTAAYSVHNGRVLFDDCNVVTADTMPEQFRRRLYRIDNSTGKVDVTSTWDRNKRSHERGFVLRNRQEILDFRRVMIALDGRAKSFYIPTFAEDLTVKATMTVGALTMDVERHEYTRLIQSRLPKNICRITFNQGDPPLVRDVASAVNVDATTERLTFDAGQTWPATRQPADVSRIEFFELVRFDADNVPIKYPRIGLATCKMPVVQVFDDNE